MHILLLSYYYYGIVAFVIRLKIHSKSKIWSRYCMYPGALSTANLMRIFMSHRYIKK